MATGTRVLFIAVDAGDKDLIGQWADEGHLPTFRSLSERGAWGPTANPVGLFVGSIWPSFWTGLSPGRHGRYCFTQLRTGTYDVYPVDVSEATGVPFWETLSRMGQRVAIVDVPKSTLSTNLNGIQAADWGTHDPTLPFRTWPESLAREIETEIGTHPVGANCDAYHERGPGGLESLREALLSGVERKERLTAHLLERGGWDLFLTVFSESHCAGHQFWKVHDPKHPRHDTEAAKKQGDPLRDVYVALDAAIGRLIARASPDTAVFVLASHGMGPHYDATFLLDRMLRRIFGKPATPETTGWKGVARSMWRRIPRGWRQRLRPVRDGAKRALGDADTDPASLPCFTVPNNDVYGAIRVNLVGREPKGRVQPGAEYEAVCESLTRDLLAFVNLDTGRPLVRRVVRAAELYRGERVRDLPDLLVEWDRDAPITNVFSEKTGPIHGVFAGQRTGDHKPEGMIFAYGPGIAPGRLRQPVSILQFAPTIAARLGVSLPDVDGTPVPEFAQAPALRPA